MRSCKLSVHCVGLDCCCYLSAVLELSLYVSLPSLRAYCPDLIIISAGFDGAHRDAGNIKNVGKSTEGMDLLPEDYEWLTTKVVVSALVFIVITCFCFYST